MSTKVCLPLLLGIALLFAGCLHGSDLDPEEEVEQAIADLEAGMGPNGDVKRFTGEFEADGMKMEMDIEFGANDALRIQVDAGMFQMTITCIDDRSYVSFAGEAYESRFDEEMCNLDSEEGPDLGIDEEAEIEIIRVEEQDDGSLLAEVRQTEDGVETLVTFIVRDKKVVMMEMEDDEFFGSFEIEHGTRRAFSAPSTEGRLPASVDWTTTFMSGTYEGTIEEVDVEAPLHEFEIRVYGHDDTPIATFPLDQPGSSGGFQFTYHDDADGLLSEADRFVIERSDWEWEYEYEVVFFDEWAGMRTDENPIPIGMGVWAAVGLVLVATIGSLRRK